MKADTIERIAAGAALIFITVVCITMITACTSRPQPPGTGIYRGIAP